MSLSVLVDCGHIRNAYSGLGQVACQYAAALSALSAAQHEIALSTTNHKITPSAENLEISPK